MLPIKHSSSRGKGMRESASPQREREINDWPLTHRPAHCGHNSGQPKCQVQHAADCWAESSLFVRDIGHHLFSYFVVHLENKTIASIAGFFFCLLLSPPPPLRRYCSRGIPSSAVASWSSRKSISMFPSYLSLSVSLSTFSSRWLWRMLKGSVARNWGRCS